MESLSTELISQLGVNRTQLQELQDGIERFSKLFDKDEINQYPTTQPESNKNGSDLELSNYKLELENAKKKLVEYEKEIVELRSQNLEQEELLQEHEEATSTLMHSFRNRAKELISQFDLFKSNYNKQIYEEKKANENLREENGRLRELLSKLTEVVMETEGLNQLEQDLETDFKEEELARLSFENESLRKLLDIHTS